MNTHMVKACRLFKPRQPFGMTLQRIRRGRPDAASRPALALNMHSKCTPAHGGCANTTGRKQGCLRTDLLPNGVHPMIVSVCALSTSSQLRQSTHTARQSRGLPGKRSKRHARMQIAAVVALNSAPSESTERRMPQRVAAVLTSSAGTGRCSYSALRKRLLLVS